jgi:Spy/CpxP family protein refolding chaperone
MLVALLAGFGGVWLGRTVFDRDGGRPTLHDLLHDELQLTADQQRRIETLEADFAVRRRALEAEMRAANAELATAIREEHGMGPRVTAAVKRFHDAMGELQTAMLEHVFAMREVLTPEQKAKFDNLVASALTTDRQ